jgi:tRNA/tmRNA/rRNA uracil-C5-methylase (TrmA/RlmC/RlmD family)
MLAELAAANAAFAVIKQCVQNGQDIAKAGKAIGSFVSAKEELQREGNKKRARGVGGSDLEEFMALEQIKAKEQQLKEMMIYAGRPGMWRDYERFCEEARNGRAAAAKAAARRKAELQEKIGLGLVGLLLAACLGGLVYIVLLMKGSLR